MTSTKRTAIAAVGVALLSFVLYHATLLPGVDFGDTPSFQVMGGDPAITPRDAYPLYFAAGAPFVWLTGDRAHGLNLASAVEGAVATGLLVLAAAELCGALLPAVAAALLFAGSYTFWSQSIITEVYALHMCMVSLSLWLLLRWEARPTLLRLAAFFAAYAIGFGDHLAMVLLLPGYTLFLLIAAPGGWRSMLRPRVVGLALGIAAVGALQYAWNLHNLWLAPIPPQSLTEALGRFWFDVTKSDWRESMVASVPRMMAGERLRMYAFDVRQQFGLVGPVLAAIGIIHLAREAPRRAWLFLVLYLVNVGFALTYNVGDSHVFFLPSHLILALLFAPALELLDLHAFMIPSALAVLLATWTFYGNYPALDRSADTRPTDLLAGLTSGLDDAHDVLLTDLNWQEQNGLTYFTKAIRRDVAVAGMPDVLPHAGQLIADNLAIGREVVLSGKAKDDLVSAYGERFRVAPDSRGATSSLSDTVIGLSRGTRYVLTVLRPPRGLALDVVDMSRALRLLGAESAIDRIGQDDFLVVAGLAGAPPTLVRSAHDPFREHTVLDGVSVDVRMESWLAFDTIRRMGFGQVVAAHHHTLIVERGVSFAAFGQDGKAIRQGYTSSLFAPERRWAIVSP
jgi:hypothetical protein